MDTVQQYFNVHYALTTPIVFASFGVSCVIAVLIFVLCWRRSSRRSKSDFSDVKGHRSEADQQGSSGRHASGRGSRLDAVEDASLLNASLLRGSVTPSPRNTLGVVVPKKPRRDTASTAFEDWGRSVTAYGLDLGSYAIKGHVFRQNIMSELAGKRSVVSVVEEGIVIGDVEVALENPGTSFFSLTRDLAVPDSTVSMNDVIIHPYQALAGAIMFMIGDRSPEVSAPPVGVCVPPYLQHIAQFLYLAASSANAHRFLIYSHSAACIASLLRQRQQNTKRQTHKPPRNVVFVDFGRSGIAAYFCEVRDSAGSVRFQTFRSAGVQNMESHMVMELSSGLSEQQQLDETIMARVIEAAKDIKEDFASVPEYLAATKRAASVRLNGTDIVLEMTRERFDEQVQLAMRDVEEVMEDLSQWITQNMPNTSIEEIELNLIGSGFRYKPFRNVFEQRFDRRQTSIDKVNVSMGLAQLMVMEHPLFEGQRFDVYPLFQLPTVDELGVRKFEDVTAKRFSMMSPRGAQRNSSQLARERSRSESSLATAE